MTERLVEDYLAAVARACAGLPASARMELMADLREHIAVARAELPEQTEAAIQAILNRLGSPAAIAAEARASSPPQPVSMVHRPMPMRRPSATPASVVALIILVPVGIVFVTLVLGLLMFYLRA